MEGKDEERMPKRIGYSMVKLGAGDRLAKQEEGKKMRWKKTVKKF